MLDNHKCHVVTKPYMLIFKDVSLYFKEVLVGRGSKKNNKKNNKLTKPNQCLNQLNGFSTICGQNLSLAQFIETPVLTIYHYTVKGR